MCLTSLVVEAVEAHLVVVTRRALLKFKDQGARSNRTLKSKTLSSPTLKSPQ